MMPVIIDWRAPVASLYYEERLETRITWPRAGDVRGTMTLKRQYNIEDAKLQNLFDIDITTNDTFLQSSWVRMPIPGSRTLFPPFRLSRTASSARTCGRRSSSRAQPVPGRPPSPCTALPICLYP